MKIAYITMKWPMRSETFAARDVNALSEQGHDVSVFAIRPDFRDTSSLKASLAVENISAVQMRFFNIIKGVILLCRHPFIVAWLLCALFKNEKRLLVLFKSVLLFPSVFYIGRDIEKGKFDVIHLFWGHFPSLVGLYLKKKNPKTIVTQFLGPYDLQYNYGLSALMAEQSHAVFTHVNSNVSVLKSAGLDPAKIHVVYRGIEVQNLEVASKKQASFIYVGRLMKAKGIYELLEVFAGVLKKVPNAHLTVIGDGEERGAFETQIDKMNLLESVSLKGWLPPDAVMSELSKSQILLFLSHSERLPNAIKEAMALDVIPISSNTSGISELIDHDNNGFIIDENEYENIPALVENLIQDSGRCEILRKNAREAILDKFDVKASMKRYISVWNNIIETQDL